MAFFYPDELSPIEKLRSSGKADLCDSNLVSMNRRQWKSLVFGKKDFGANNFATIAEEEEDVSSDGTNGVLDVDRQIKSSFVPKKKIIFPKPRRYITPRVADREEDLSFGDTILQTKETSSEKKSIDYPGMVNDQKVNPSESKQLIKNKKSENEESMPQKLEIMSAYAMSEIGLGEENREKKWKDVTINPPMLTGWPKPEKWKVKKKDGKKKAKPPDKKLEQKKSRKENEAKMSKTFAFSNEKDKSFNMKDVVNVYKNLTYGTKDEIKSFVEKLSFVKDEDGDKNLLSMMNLKALETKIKDLEKKTGHGTMQMKKRVKSGKKTRKNHTENLVRHKVVKVPATLDYTYSPESRNLSYASGINSEQKRKSSNVKVPWKYVGRQSILDKMYFVYPSYPKPESKKAVKKSESESKKQKKEIAAESSTKNQSKVKQSKEILIRQNSGIRNGGSRSANPLALSATTVCTVKFRPETERKAFSAGSSAQSLLFYLHDTKATHVRSPYSDKQFSRVNFFRKNGARSPLVRGIDLGETERNVAVHNIRMPVNLTGCRFEELLDFEEDIQNINEFLRSQSRNRCPSRGKRNPVSLQRPLFNAETSNRRKSHKLLTESIVADISRDIEALQYLPDTEENRQIIENFFDELDQRIESSKTEHFSNTATSTNNNSNIPIVGY